MKIQLANGITANYLERGNPNGLPIIFLHGFPFSHKMWDPQMRALPSSYRAICYDIRGHGESQVADGQYTIEFFVDDLIALLDYLVIDKAVLCGLSMGGYIALRAVERHPERVRALILADTKSTADSNEARVKRSASMTSVKSEGIPAFAESFSKAIFAQETFSKNSHAVTFIKDLIRANTILGISGTLLAMAARTDTTESLSRINVPTLILVGEEDAITPPSEAEAMHSMISGSKLVRIPGAAHMSNIENEAAFNLALLEFLKSL
jgi:3-oxoadipate enol-lactonase